MSKIWIICGAGRGVGKTTLALQLCKVLLDSVYTKCGHGKQKSGKTVNFFSNIKDLEAFIEAKRNLYKHIVVESNTLSVSDRDCIIIFLDGITGKTNFHKDREKIKSAADIKICRDVNISSWKKVLSDNIDSQTTCHDIYNILLSQKHYLFASMPTVRSKVWFESDGTHIFGNGLAILLENVHCFGTLQEAAKTSNMSYRYAWKLIHNSEHHFGKVLLNRQPGGQHGGSSELTSDGLHILEVFKQLKQQVAVFTDKKFIELYAQEKVNA